MAKIKRWKMAKDENIRLVFTCNNVCKNYKKSIKVDPHLYNCGNGVFTCPECKNKLDYLFAEVK